MTDPSWPGDERAGDHVVEAGTPVDRVLERLEDR
jgi:hypothetical protein